MKSCDVITCFVMHRKLSSLFIWRRKEVFLVLFFILVKIIICKREKLETKGSWRLCDKVDKRETTSQWKKKFWFFLFFIVPDFTVKAERHEYNHSVSIVTIERFTHIWLSVTLVRFDYLIYSLYIFEWRTVQWQWRAKKKVLCLSGSDDVWLFVCSLP